MMTKQDSEAFAQEIREHRKFLMSHGEFTNNEVAVAMTSLKSVVKRVLQRSNPRFDCKRFIDACNRMD